jgi:hypothetical protein
MYQKLGTQWAGSMLGFISIALLPIPLLLFRFARREIYAYDRYGKKTQSLKNEGANPVV